MADGLKLSLSGEMKKVEGEITGNGELKLDLDLTKISFKVDYKSEDKVILKLNASQGFRISADSTLRLSGGLTHDLLNKTWEGKVELKVNIGKKIAAQLSQTIKPGIPSTAVEFTFVF